MSLFDGKLISGISMLEATMEMLVLAATPITTNYLSIAIFTLFVAFTLGLSFYFARRSRSAAYSRQAWISCSVRSG